LTENLQVNLSWKLSLVLKDLAPPSLLTSYNAERLPVIAQMLHATTALYTHTVAKEKAADVTEQKTEDENASGWYRWRNNALEMYGVNYRHSDIVLEERDTTPQDAEDLLAHVYSGYEGLGTLHAGDRAPEAPGLIPYGTDRETSLLTLFKPSLHSVLVFLAEDDNVDGLASRYPKDAVQTFIISRKDLGPVEGGIGLVDREGHAYNAYLVEEGVTTIVVVRPDTFIGAIVKDTAGVDRYFSKILKFS